MTIRSRLLLAAVLLFTVNLVVAAPSATSAQAAAPQQQVAEPNTKYPNIPFSRRPAEGWHFYDDPSEEEVRPEMTEGSVFAHMSQFKTAEDVQKELKRMLDRAVLFPTDENMKEYMYAQKFIMEKGTIFADTWKRIVVQNFDLDYSNVRPVNASAIFAYKDARSADESKYLRDLGQSGVGLFFFYSSTCPYCMQIAPVLRFLESEYSMKVLAISMDGGTLPEFPNSQIDNGISERLGVSGVPALYLADPRNNQVVQLGSGMMSVAEITDRIMITYRYSPGSTW